MPLRVSKLIEYFQQTQYKDRRIHIQQVPTLPSARRLIWRGHAPLAAMGVLPPRSARRRNALRQEAAPGTSKPAYGVEARKHPLASEFKFTVYLPLLSLFDNGISVPSQAIARMTVLVDRNILYSISRWVGGPRSQEKSTQVVETEMAQTDFKEVCLRRCVSEVTRLLKRLGARVRERTEGKERRCDTYLLISR
jgi:hypothetical protein